MNTGKMGIGRKFLMRNITEIIAGEFLTLAMNLIGAGSLGTLPTRS
jgi:hypothetical protein